MRNRKISRTRIVRHALGLGAFVLGAASCESALDLKHGTPLPPENPGGEGGESRGGTGGATSGSSGVGGSASGRGGTSPSGGDSGAPGKGGDGGEPPGGEGGVGASSGAGGGGGGDDGPCVHDEDCPNTDPYCRMECRRMGATTACVAVGADVDQDQHLSAACEANPGDDCDDRHDDVYEGAPELCDGLDNDCDGKSDLEEFGLSGSVLTISEEQAIVDADIAWSEPELTWGVVFDNHDDVKYQPMTGSGGMPVAPIPLTTLHSVWSGVAIEWGSDAFAVAYGASDYNDVFFRTIGADGTPKLDEMPLGDIPEGFGSDYPGWLWLGTGSGWAATWMDYRDNNTQVFARKVAENGTLGNELPLGYGSFVDIASAGGNLASVWQGDGSEGSIGTDALTSTMPLALATEAPGPGEFPIVASSADRFLVAARFPPDKFGITELAVDGHVLCGPVTREADGFVPGDSAPSRNGFLVFSATPVVEMLEVLPGCQYGRVIPLSTSAARFVGVARWANGGFGVIWGGYDQPLKGRFFGPNFCD